MCGKYSRLIIEGVNDFATKKPELIKYFKNPSDAKKHSKNSNKKVDLICPICKRQKQMSYNNLSKHGFSCKFCTDASSYPERLLIAMFEQLDIEYDYQVSQGRFKWLGNKRYKYDFYIPELNAIIETHGLQHYKTVERFKNDSNQKDIDAKKRKLALNNGISYYFEVDCRKSNVNWIKNSIINSELLNLLNIDKENIDWSLCSIKAHTMTEDNIKEICEYWNSNIIDKYICITDLCEYFNRKPTYIRECLKYGNKIGICSYNANEARHNSKIQKRIPDAVYKEIGDYWEAHKNEKITTNDVSEYFKISQSVACNYLKEARNKGYCSYDSKEQLLKSLSNNMLKGVNKKNVFVFDKNNIIFHEEESVTNMAEYMTKTTDKIFTITGIARVCRKERKTYHGYIFRYDFDDEFKTQLTNQN